MKKLILILIVFLTIGSANAQWNTIYSDTNSYYSIYFPSKNIGYAVGERLYSGGIIIKTNDAGLTWSNPSDVSFRTLESVYFLDSINGFAVDLLGAIYKTTDGALTWTQIYTVDISLEFNFYSIYFINANKGFAVGIDESPFYFYDWKALILSTNDGGSTWTKEEFPSGGIFTSVFFPDTNTGYIVGTGGVILKSIDCGTNWTILNTSLPPLNSAYFINDNLGYVVGNYGKIYKTIDGGSNWISQNTDSMYFDTLYNLEPINLQSVYFTDATHGFIVGYVDYPYCYGVILRTNDGGTTWVSQTLTNENYFSSVYFTSQDTGYITSYWGKILKTTDGGGTWLKANNLINNTSIYPNPSSNSITIDTKSNTKQTFEIVNQYGQTMNSYIINSKTTIDISHFPKGIYILKQDTDKGIVAKKFIKE